jgi:CRISPR-associated endoribonuclease Cas6
MKLYASVIRLFNLYPVTIPAPGGQHAHAAFFDIVREVDPALSQALHDQRGKGARKPFTVSPILGLPRRAGGEALYHLREGWECWLRVTMLNETLFRTFVEYFLDARNKTLPRLRLGDAHFAVSEILTTPGSHPWAGFTTLEDLQRRLDEPAPASIAFEFHSPVSFKLRDETVELIPYPKLVFGNLATAWKALSGEDLVKAVEQYAEANLRLVIHRLERRASTLRNHRELGMVGRVEYQFIQPDDAPLARALHLLADLAFYAGIGRKTAQGMGMARRVESVSRAPAKDVIRAM